jgi:hypothetical protein
MQPLASLRRTIARLWAVDRTLTAAGLLMAAVLPLFLLGIAIDDRVITGAPAWLKPAKFAVSTAIYMLTLAWVFSYLPGWPRVRTFVSRMTAAVMVLEVAIIALQAWRGTTSHFNISTPFNATLFVTMGTAILVQTVTSVLVAIALWRQPFANAALGWALRLGMVITIIGASVGGMMTRPTRAQLADAAVTQRMAIVGAHTVGAPDGGRGLPGTGWSLEHGDIRVAHFAGLHALQALPLLAWSLGLLGVHMARRARLVVVSAGSYLSLFALLLWQALRGQSVIAPDAAGAIALVLWAVLTGVMLAWPFRRHRTAAEPDGWLNWINP